MSLSTITRRLEIDAGHRLIRHGGKCKNAHGHRYKFEVSVAGEQDEVGRIIDFSALKGICAQWLDEKWDHGMILQLGDPLIKALEHDGSKHYVMDEPPTVENILVEFRRNVEKHLVGEGLALQRVRVYETPNCWADWEAAHFGRGGW